MTASIIAASGRLRRKCMIRFWFQQQPHARLDAVDFMFLWPVGDSDCGWPGESNRKHIALLLRRDKRKTRVARGAAPLEQHGTVLVQDGRGSGIGSEVHEFAGIFFHVDE